MNAEHLAALINATATYTVAALSFPVRILSAQFRYGRVDVQITPIGGSGQRWVRLANVTLTK